MIEFGSDFHSISYREGENLINFFPSNNLYALGRHAFLELILYLDLKKLWVPDYYCRASLSCLENLDIKISFYESTPLINPVQSIADLNIQSDEAVLIMNYFGLWGDLESPKIPGILIEDHSHDLLSNWARNSKADWCFASLRKTIPIAEGGILWSPQNYTLPSLPQDSISHADNAKLRHLAMDLKTEYLKNQIKEKEEFLNLYNITETEFDSLKPSPINSIDLKIISQMNITEWYHIKRQNWDILRERLCQLEGIDIMGRNSFIEHTNNTPFSLVILFANEQDRDEARKRMINNKIYPAILWKLPSNSCKESTNFSSRMLSIHCDGRYSKDDMTILADKLIKIIQLK